MIDRLRTELAALEAAAAPLEPGPEARAALMDQAFGHAQHFLGQLPDGPANRSWDDVFAAPFEPEFAEAGRGSG